MLTREATIIQITRGPQMNTAKTTDSTPKKGTETSRGTVSIKTSKDGRIITITIVRAVQQHKRHVSRLKQLSEIPTKY